MQRVRRMAAADPLPDVRETKLWRTVFGRGFLALLFALLALADPWMPVDRLAKLLAAYAFADGALAFYAARRAHRTHAFGHGRALALEGLVGAAVGVAALVLPVVAALRIIGGLRWLAIGASEVVWSRRDQATELVELGGIMGVALGILVLAWPGPALVALPWLLGLAALVSGALDFAGSMSHIRSEVVLGASPAP